MEIKKLTPDKYQEWDEFCLESNDVWFWHTSQWLEYNLNYKIEARPVSKSFMARNNNKIVAICPLILENNNNVREFTFAGAYGPAPAFANSLNRKGRRNLMKLVFEHIDNLARENNVKRAQFRFSPLSKSFIEPAQLQSNYLMKFGYLDNSLNTQVIDLDKPIQDIKSSIRIDHRHSISQSSKLLKAEIFNNNNISQGIFEQYIDLHCRAAGRITRPKITFDIMYDLIKQDRAFLIGAKKDNVFIGFAYFYLFKNNVYWGSACNDPGLKHIPINHFIQWAAIQWMRAKQYKFYEIGWQQYANTLSDFPSEKEINISLFKRGFGGFPAPVFRGEKYYDKNYFLEVYQKRVSKYADLI